MPEAAASCARGHRAPLSWLLGLPKPGRALLLSLAALLLCPACASRPTAETSDDPEEKSVLVGELLAIFPGFFVHGLGHRYAENDDVADELLYMEVYSVLTVGLGAALWGLGEAEDADALRIAGYVGMGVGAVPFLGTWIYDIAFTPSEINRYNEQLRASSQQP